MMHTRAERKMLPLGQPARGAKARAASLERNISSYRAVSRAAPGETEMDNTEVSL